MMTTPIPIHSIIVDQQTNTNKPTNKQSIKVTSKQAHNAHGIHSILLGTSVITVVGKAIPPVQISTFPPSTFDTAMGEYGTSVCSFVRVWVQ